MYYYLFQTELFDDMDDRFWFGNVTIPSAGPLSMTEVNAQIRTAINSRLAQPQYEKLSQWMDQHDWTPLENLVGVYFHE